MGCRDYAAGTVDASRVPRKKKAAFRFLSRIDGRYGGGVRRGLITSDYEFDHSDDGGVKLKRSLETLGAVKNFQAPRLPECVGTGGGRAVISPITQLRSFCDFFFREDSSRNARCGPDVQIFQGEIIYEVVLRASCQPFGSLHSR